jgi:hypothetical protein
MRVSSCLRPMGITGLRGRTAFRGAHQPGMGTGQACRGPSRVRMPVSGSSNVGPRAAYLGRPPTRSHTEGVYRTPTARPRRTQGNRLGHWGRGSVRRHRGHAAGGGLQRRVDRRAALCSRHPLPHGRLVVHDRANGPQADGECELDHGTGIHRLRRCLVDRRTGCRRRTTGGQS